MSNQRVTDIDRDLSDIILLLWGRNIKEDIFLRWTQGFIFSSDEPSALVQLEGGPCAVLAPVQAYIIKQLITHKNENEDWRSANSEEQNKLLISAVSEILEKAQRNAQYRLVYIESDNADIKEEPVYVYFHNHLRINTCSNIEEVRKFFSEKIDILRDTYGVLLFLYSVVCTRGLDTIANEMAGNDEPLIDYNHGYGSQVLTNLMITGNAVDNVFNDNCEIGGLTLHGIPKQSEVGYLTILEHLRYCEVGSYLKNPYFPIWVLGSETHLTVLFSFERKLAGTETKRNLAKRMFGYFDQEGNDFIKSDSLGELLRKLDLPHDEESVKSTLQKLDPEQFGIILLSNFLEEFFPITKDPHPDTFTVYHYNGQPFSNINDMVMYRSGSAIMLESEVMSVNENDQLLTCLQTKWQNIDIQWDSATFPSLN